MLAKYLNVNNCPVPIWRLGGGYYLFGTKKIYAKILNFQLCRNPFITLIVIMLTFCSMLQVKGKRDDFTSRVVRLKDGLGLSISNSLKPKQIANFKKTKKLKFSNQEQWTLFENLKFQTRKCQKVQLQSKAMTKMILINNDQSQPCFVLLSHHFPHTNV